MRFRFPPALAVVVLLAVCISVVVFVAYLRYQRNTTEGLYARLPAKDAVVVYVDFGGLRKAGVLEIFSGSDVVREPEYRAFVEATGFDYQRDLDSALAAFEPGGSYFLLRGRFDWKSLNDYIVRQSGTCYNSFCRVAGSTPDRRISFFPLQPDMMALAVAKDDSAASLMLDSRRARTAAALPSQPVWAIVPAATLKRADALPPGLRLFAKALEGADRIVLSLGPNGGRIELALDVSCRSKEDAALLVAHLVKTTAALRQIIAQESKQPSPGDLSGILTAGVFSQDQQRVTGRWPIERAFLETLAGTTP